MTGGTHWQTSGNLYLLKQRVAGQEGLLLWQCFRVTGSRASSLLSVLSQLLRGNYMHSWAVWATIVVVLTVAIAAL